MSNPFFSIIIPTHDRPDDLANALSSLSRQSFDDFEVVVVNDGEASVVDVVASSGLPRTQMLCTSGHLGPSAARNIGLDAAVGEVITYLDDDDLYKPDHLSVHAARYAEDPDVHVVYSDAELIVVGPDSIKAEVVHSRDFDRDSLLVANYIPILCLSHRRKCLEKVGQFEESLHYLEDWDLFIRLAVHWPFIHESRTTAAYLEKQTGQSVQDRFADRFIESLNTVYSRSEKLLADDPAWLARVRDMRLVHVAVMSYDTGVLLEQGGDLEGALNALGMAVRCDPLPRYYLALARVNKALGNRKEALSAMLMAERLAVE